MQKLLVLFMLVVLIACKKEKRYHDEIETSYLPVSDTTDFIYEVRKFQLEMNNDFKNPETSPLTEKQRKTFTGLDFFSPDSLYRVTALLNRTPDAVPFLMPTTTSRTPEYKKYGIVEFKLFDKTYQLNIYQNQELKLDPEYRDDLFLLFTDKTNGNQTYGGGRYVNLSIPKTDTIVIDFNRAYNPYCAYNKKYSCPKVPSENHLALEVLAGVKSFKK